MLRLSRKLKVEGLIGQVSRLDRPRTSGIVGVFTAVNRKFSRSSLERSQPLIAGALTGGLVLVFTGVAFAGGVARGNDALAKETLFAKSAAARAIAAGEPKWADDIFALAEHAQFVLLDDQGRVVAGHSDTLNARQLTREDIHVDGAPAAQLMIRATPQPALAMPLWLIGVLAACSVGLAMLLGRLYSRVILVSLAQIEEAVDAVANGRPQPSDQKIDFGELRRLAGRLLRHVRRLYRQRDALNKLAYFSPATELPNPNGLARRFAPVLDDASFDDPAGFLSLRVEQFARACELLGADAGTDLLQMAAERMQSELKTLAGSGNMAVSRHFLAHFQDEEFGLLLPNITSRREASAVARALRAAFVRPFVHQGRNIRLGLSGGIVIAPEDGDRHEDLIRRARMAHESLAEEGRAGFRFFTPRLDRAAKGRLQLETEIRIGLSKGEFCAHFQPKIDFRSGRLAGCEALARWEREGGRSISPGAFIPVAEETGLIDEIGKLMLRQSCEAAVGWLRSGHAIPISVNVSPSQIDRGDFRETVIDALTRSGLPPRYLELEITESMAVGDPKKFERVMHPLKAMGVRLSIDDFGTGHSNLAILSRLNFDVFKIDRQFISGLNSDESAPAIVEMILAMAETLGLETVAEGIETPEQARFLRRRGCTLGQGFLYSRPLNLQDFTQFMEQWRSRRQARTA